MKTQQKKARGKAQKKTGAKTRGKAQGKTQGKGQGKAPGAEKAGKAGQAWVVVLAVVTAALLAATARSGGGGDGTEGDRDAKAAASTPRATAPGALAAQARRNLLTAPSLHVTVTDRSEGAGRSAPSAMDLSLDREGDCSGAVTFGARGSASVLRRDDRVWLRMDAALWRARVPGAAGRALAERIDGRYVTGPASDPTLKDLASVCDLDALHAQLRADARDETITERGGARTLHGVRVVPLTGTSTDGSGTHVTLYVTASGTPRLIEHTRTGGRTDLTTRYADQGAPVRVTQPQASDTVEVSRLGKAKGQG
ncbi:hypothetical protein [Streptomyces xanthii]|uniref:Lipoprotein n=1 Tax=Streptomyces xanthii TaxID=2768069 RepID=A0A7H1B745_9ACTN|nr:hypothetical protein [Streptomyces xanthii]QNS04550.1 hypothetical protein IAG42_13610 [Streptomyces xanthii]